MTRAVVPSPASSDATPPDATPSGATLPCGAGSASLGSRYWRFWCATTVSAFGDGLRVAALPLLAATMTRDPVVISMVSVANYLPWLLFGPIGGVIGDRGERSRTMGLANLARFWLMSSFVVLVASGHPSIAAICVLTAALTVFQIMYSSAATGYLTQIITKQRLALGNSRLASGSSLAGQFLGAPIGAFLFSIGHWVPLVIDGATFALAYSLIPRVRPRLDVPAADQARPGYLRSLGEGWAAMRRDRAITAIAALLAAINLVTVGLNAIMVLFVLEVLHAPGIVYGRLTACLALGAFIGTFTTPPLLRRLGAGRLVAFSIAARVGCLLLFGLSWSQWVCGAALVVQGLTMTSWNVVSTTTIQTRTPTALVGRVGTLVKSIAISSAPLGALAAGQIAGSWGLRTPFIAGAIVVAVAGCLTLPRLLRGLETGFRAGHSPTTAPT